MPDNSEKGKFAVEHCRGAIPPFYILRNFLDAEFGVILGFGFFKLADVIIDLKNIVRDAYIAFPNHSLYAIDNLWNNNNFLNKSSSLLMMIAIIVMFIDDYARSKIINYLAPCRSIGRFGLDVIIPFFFGLSFLLINERSSLVFACIGTAFFFGAIWSHYVENEASEWVDTQKYGGKLSIDSKHVALVKDRDGWLLYTNRLKHIANSHTFFGFFLLTASFFIMIFDNNKIYWPLYFLIFIVGYWVLETLRFRIEVNFVVEVDENIIKKYPGVLKTVVWIPEIFQRIIANVFSKY